MNVVDISIIIILLFGAILGFKRGFTKAVVSALGFIVAVIVAFKLKGVISEILYLNAPFFKFGGIFKGVTVLNIALYELIGFFIILSIMLIILKLLMVFTGLFESFLKMTIILGIPSKILGAIVGIIENYVLVFIVLYILALPVFNNKFLIESKYKDRILNETPILSKEVDKTMDVFNEFASLKEKYQTNTNAEEFNLETLRVFLKYKIISVDNVKLLMEKDKLQFDISKVNALISEYQKG